MSWVQVLIFLWILAPGTAVYIKGHSRAADKARAEIKNLTCYSSASQPQTSSATLQVDHIVDPYRQRSWVVLVLTDPENHVLFERKAEEDPWPLPAALDRLLRKLAKSTCREHQISGLALPSPAPPAETASRAKAPDVAAAQRHPDN